jgi:glycosyltransferase involved in cell wall biosynthesis
MVILAWTWPSAPHTLNLLLIVFGVNVIQSNDNDIGRDVGRFKINFLHDHKMRVTFRMRSGFVFDLDPFEEFSPHRWYHVSVTWDGILGELAVYRDGLLIAWRQRSDLIGLLGRTLVEPSVGKCLPDDVYTLEGTLSEAYMWDRPLTQGQLFTVMHDVASISQYWPPIFASVPFNETARAEAEASMNRRSRQHRSGHMIDTDAPTRFTSSSSRDDNTNNDDDTLGGDRNLEDSSDLPRVDALHAGAAGAGGGAKSTVRRKAKKTLDDDYDDSDKPIQDISNDDDDDSVGGVAVYFSTDLGGLRRQLPPTRPITRLDMKAIDVVLGVVDGSWNHVVATCALLASSSTNVVPIGTIYLLEQQYNSLPTEEVVSLLKVPRGSSVERLPITKTIHATSGDLATVLSSSEAQWILFMAPFTSPAPHFLTELVERRGNYLGVTSRILYPGGRLRHAGYEFQQTPTLDGDFQLPAHRMRGVPLGYKPSLSPTAVLAIDGFASLLQRRMVIQCGGFRSLLAPDYHFADLSLRLTEHAAGELSPLGYVPSSLVFYTPTGGRESLEYHNVADTFIDSPRRRKFLEQAPLHVLPPPPSSSSLRVLWHMHCGGSMGLEAAYLVKELEPQVTLRVHPPRYGRCEHLDTIRSLPATFRDALDRMRLKVFESDQVIIYHRDYRELGEYLPSPVQAYTIGRYMNEVQGLHKQWATQSQQLNEVWVPSQWHVDVFAAQGVDRSKLVVVPEAVDVYLLDPDIIQPLLLRERRGWAFLSVFKFEERKGWRELVQAYFSEFRARDDVSLILHTYLYNGDGDQWNRDRLISLVHQWLISVDALPPLEERPHFDIVGHYLSAEEMGRLYASADAYVGASYGEGWGLPFHEAMSMGLPVVATRWSGQTEFLNDDVAYMVEIEELVESPKSDPWFGGMKWAKPSVCSLQQQMRRVFSDQAMSRERGRMGRRWVTERYSMVPVAKRIEVELQRIESTVRFPVVKPTYHDDTMTWVSRSRDMQLCTILPITPTAAQLTERSIRQKEVKTCVSKYQTGKVKGREASCARVAVISTFPPTHCGIATFATSLLHGMVDVGDKIAHFELFPVVDDLYRDVNLPSPIIPLRGTSPPSSIEQAADESLMPPAPVRRVIRKQNAADYVAAAEDINNNFDMVLLQHEFGLFGGAHGAYIVCLARLLQVPLITVFHTVHEFINKNEHTNLIEVHRASTHSVVMTKLARRYLHMFHGIPVADNVAVIPHGVPELIPMPLDRAKAKHKLTGRLVLTSTGLLHPGKGMDNVLRALPAIIEALPNVTYVIAGEPHPSCGKPCAEYVKTLKSMVVDLKLEDHVVIKQQYLTNPELYSLIQATDIYIAAYTEADVSSSGTVSIAMAARRVVVATPFIYTKEVLAYDRGVVLPSFRDPSSISMEVIALGRDPQRMRDIGSAAYRYARNMLWPEVGRQYLKLMGLVPPAASI